jgi:hypothetical protein
MHAPTGHLGNHSPCGNGGAATICVKGRLGDSTILNFELYLIYLEPYLHGIAAGSVTRSKPSASSMFPTFLGHGVVNSHLRVHLPHLSPDEFLIPPP